MAAVSVALRSEQAMSRGWRKGDRGDGGTAYGRTRARARDTLENGKPVIPVTRAVAGGSRGPLWAAQPHLRPESEKEFAGSPANNTPIMGERRPPAGLRSGA